MGFRGYHAGWFVLRHFGLIEVALIEIGVILTSGVVFIALFSGFAVVFIFVV